MPLNDPAKNAMLDALNDGVKGITYIGIHQLTDPGTATNCNTGEAATTGSPAYQRRQVLWQDAANGLKTNSGQLTFDVPAGTYGFFTLWNTATIGVTGYRGYIPFGGSNALRGFFEVDSTASYTTEQLLSKSHGMSDGDRVILYNVFSEALPTGTTEGVIYYVVGSTPDSFKVSTSFNGTPVDITGPGGGEGYWQRVVPETFGSQGQITVATSALVLDATAF